MSDIFGLKGKVALITGGASGIGKGAALAFAEQGVRIGLMDRPGEELDKAVAEFKEKGAEVEAIEADVADAEQVRQGIAALVARFGRLDIVYANAGINGVWAPIEELEPEEFDRTIAINLRGTFLTIKYAAPYLKWQGGCVLVTSSVNGTRIFSNSGATAYSASKAAQVAMVKMLAVELGQDKIRVNAICPGAISTNIGASTEQRDTESIKIPVEYPEGSNPLTGKESGTTDQVGKVAVFLASDMASHVNGEIVYVDGGASLVTG